MTWSRRTNRVALDLEQAGQDLRDLDAREPALAGLRIAQADRDRQAERRDVRERVARVHRERRQDREDLVEEALAERLVVLRDRRVVDQLDALGGEGPADVDVDRRVVGDELADALADGGELLLGGPAVGRAGDASDSSCWRRPATRTWKNSSRLPAKMARNLTRSRSGLRSSRASWSTRALNSSQLSSRLRIGPRWSRAARRRPRLATRGPGAGWTVAMDPRGPAGDRSWAVTTPQSPRLTGSGEENPTIPSSPGPSRHVSAARLTAAARCSSPEAPQGVGDAGSIDEATRLSRWPCTVRASSVVGSISTTRVHSRTTPSQFGCSRFRYRKPRS